MTEEERSHLELLRKEESLAYARLDAVRDSAGPEDLHDLHKAAWVASNARSFYEQALTRKAKS